MERYELNEQEDYFRVTGAIVRFRRVNGGILFTLVEPGPPRAFTNMAIWEPQATAIEPHLKRGQTFTLFGVIEKPQSEDEPYESFQVRHWQPGETRIKVPTRFDIQGFIANIRPLRDGLIVTIGQPSRERHVPTVFNRLAIWGKMADAIGKKLAKGRTFKFTGDISKNRKDGRTHLNYTVSTWRQVSREPIQRRTWVERDDDWFVPEPSNRDSTRVRAGEGFTGGGRW